MTDVHVHLQVTFMFRHMARTVLYVQTHGTHSTVCSDTWHAQHCMFRHMARTALYVQTHGTHSTVCSDTWHAQYCMFRHMARTVLYVQTHGTHSTVCLHVPLYTYSFLGHGFITCRSHESCVPNSHSYQIQQL